MKLFVKYPSFLLLILTFACQETDFSVDKVKIDYSYFPLDSGMWREFKVKEINIDAPLEIYDTQEYYIRQVFGPTFINNSGDTMMQINRFYRENETDGWQQINTWLTGINDGMAIQKEENTMYIKLKFPLITGKHWDGNAFNRNDTLKLHAYEILSLDEPFEINNLIFDSVSYISQKAESTAISKLDFFERYAKHVGLIQKQEIDIRSEILDDLSVPIEQRVTQGYFYYQNLIRYGN